MSQENACKICFQEFPSSLGLANHRCGQPAIQLCSRCEKQPAVEYGAWNDAYCARCYRIVTTEGEP